MQRKWIITGVAIIFLIGGYIYGISQQKMDEKVIAGLYKKLIPEAAKFEPMSDRTAQAFDATGKLMAYVGLSSHNGYGGPMLVGTIVDPSGKLREPVILENNETPSFLMRLAAGGYYKQYMDLPVNSILMLNQDLDAITGATLASRAVSDSVRENAHSIARVAFHQNPEQPVVQWQFGMKEMMAILLFTMSFVIYKVKKLQKYRLIFLGASTIILGFWLNRSLSVAQFSSLFLGYLPSPKTNLLFYIVLAGVIAPILFSGKNIYCLYVCPFCGIQEAAYKISGKNIPLRKARIWLVRLRNLLLFAVLMGAVITAKANAITYEPFGVAFGLDLRAESYLWYILFAALISAFLFRKLWCVGFCPAGAFLDILEDLAKAIRKKCCKIKEKDVLDKQEKSALIK
ncbi:MAG: 4Fe-4S binding protein [Dehalobacter sp. 4CP]|uniref:4Fe-4S binding protein n=1 Tax=Dehalobacter sp. CP TaxID=2594474 RepID=UPI0003683B89|nr:4Fe-4S binding protein [Dehalobacter sp.]NBJ14388.1 4Fe-4S binding protein [Dehalobacter sp. 4CP]